MSPPVYTIPSALEACLRTVVPAVPIQSLAKSVAELSALFTTHRARRPPHYFDKPELRAAYAAYFLPANYNKLHAVLDEMGPLLERQLQTAGKTPFRMLDLGAGPGTMTLAAVEYFSRQAFARPWFFVTVDSSRQALKWCGQLFRCFCERSNIPAEQAILETISISIQQSLERLPPVPFDLIVMANAWNEVVEDDPNRSGHSAAWVRKLMDHLQPAGSLILIEPALRETSRTLHFLHDALLAENAGINVFAPCLHQRSCPCVADGNEKDWCHAEHEWRPTRQVAILDQWIGNHKDAMKFSYLVLRKDGKNALNFSRNPGPIGAGWRVVSELIREKGRMRAFLCGAAGRIQFVRLDRHAGKANETFSRLLRGDVVKITGAEPRQSDWRILETTAVERI